MPSPTSTRPSPAVYRRRRLVALLLLLLLLAGIGWGVTALLARGQDAGGGGTEPAAAEDAGAGETEPADGEAEPADGEVVACDASTLEADLLLDPPTPSAGAAVSFQLTLRNDGQQPCLLDAGPASLAASVRSGGDAVWSSAHCAGDAAEELLLDAGSETSVTVAWDGRRSAEGCPGDQPQVAAGTYRVALALAGEPLADNEVFTIE